ncbi:FecR domain-containing protein [uncultured Roseivirga sp.]|uniref:FecR family protein n=1 Tax=uncultured Roseivirga sp. TaxID=543088 RepID=UPI0030DB6E44|tara:strand:+ start:28016 stop:28978 length:963 start_codon:yes stop_codon:yes gene_type:complete
MHQNQNTNQHESKWLNGEISSEEFLQKAHLNVSDSLLLKSLSKTGGFDVPSNNTKAQAWAELEKKITAKKSKKVVPLYRSYWVGIAASLILAIGAFFIFKQSSTSTNQTIIATSLAEVQTVYLPDSSIVYLNAGSKISFSERQWQQERTLELSGEAFFEVKKGSDFTVETQLGNVAVLGTSFNVKERNNILEVTCKTGEVKVTIKPSGKFEIITPGSKLTAKEGQIEEVLTIPLSYIGNWRMGDFYFESILLKNVFEELERQYDIKFDVDANALQDRTYTGYFNNKNLNEALQLVCNPMGLTYKIEEKKVKIMSRNVQTP